MPCLLGTPCVTRPGRLVMDAHLAFIKMSNQRYGLC